MSLQRQSVVDLFVLAWSTLLAQYLTNSWEFYQTYTLGVAGDTGELIRFWAQKDYGDTKYMAKKSLVQNATFRMKN